MCLVAPPVVGQGGHLLSAGSSRGSGNTFKSKHGRGGSGGGKAASAAKRSWKQQAAVAGIDGRPKIDDFRG